MAEISGRQAQHRPGLVLPGFDGINYNHSFPAAKQIQQGKPGDPAFTHINPASQFQPQLSGRDYLNGIRKQIIAEANYER